MENTINSVQQDQSIVVAAPAANQKGKIGTSCHQCHQKMIGLGVRCTNRKDKLCSYKFCHKCLTNRYGEHVEKKSVLVDWHCPKCRGICNCSVCMQRRSKLRQEQGYLGMAQKVYRYEDELLSRMKANQNEDRAAREAELVKVCWLIDEQFEDLAADASCVSGLEEMVSSLI